MAMAAAAVPDQARSLVGSELKLCGFHCQFDLHYHRAWPCAAGILFLLATGCVGHDQLRLKDPSPCHVQCDYNQVAQLDPECHGYHPTCWSPWAADCQACPPPPSGVYPVMQDVPSPESVASPQPQSKPPQHKLPEPEPKPAPTETKPGPEIPSTPSEPTPAPSETTPKPNETTTPGETTPPGQTTPAPGESMPGPESKPEDTNQSTTPELPPLVPPGRQIPQGPQQKEHKPPEKKGAQPTSALIEDVLLQSAGCRQAKPLGTITEANEPAKLEPAPTETAQQVCGCTARQYAAAGTCRCERNSPALGAGRIRFRSCNRRRLPRIPPTSAASYRQSIKPLNQPLNHLRRGAIRSRLRGIATDGRSRRFRRRRSGRCRDRRRGCT